jgi:hypothetical protein
VGSSFFFARVLHSLTGDEPASTQAMVVEWKEQKLIKIKKFGREDGSAKQYASVS